MDSLLGATVQQTRYSKARKVVLHDDHRDADAQVVSGVRLLTNNQVWAGIYFFRVRTEPKRTGERSVKRDLCVDCRVVWPGKMTS